MMGRKVTSTRTLITRGCKVLGIKGHEFASDVSWKPKFSPPVIMGHGHGNLSSLLALATLVFCILQALPVAETSKPLGNPYHILGVTRSATVQDIRKVYKQLVKEWHPDKSDHPNAQNKFVEITKAYELLTDPERRRSFDNHGITEEGLHRDRRSTSNFNMPDPFKEQFNGNFKFHYQTRDISMYHKMSITYRAFEKTAVPKSYRSPYVILFYSDWCFACLQAEPTWRKLIEELEPLGVNLVTVHAEREHPLTKRFKVRALPSISVLIEGRTSMYKESSLSVTKIIEFLRSKLPYRLIKRVNSGNLDSFLSGWTDNKIRALIFDRKDIPRLRYLLLAYHHRDRVVFGYVQTDGPNTDSILAKYKVSADLETLLLFNENPNKPVATLSMKNIPSEAMHNIVNANKYLILPRLSNQAVMDAICPPEWKRPQKRLCAVLVSENNSRHDLARHRFRQVAIKSPHSAEKVRYAYLFKDSQPEFVSLLSVGEGSPPDPMLHVVIFWRRDAKRLEYEWLSGEEWPNDPDDDNGRWNKSRDDLDRTINRLLRPSTTLLHVAEMAELRDEHALSMLERIFAKALNMADFIYEKLTREQILTFLSILGTVGLITAAGYGMSYLVKLEEASIQAEGRGTCKNPRGASSNVPQLRLHDMRAEKYNALVRLLKPGCRTIVLLVDNQSKFKLLPAYHKAVWPYRKNKTLLFSHLSLERGLDWYKKILSLSLPEPRELNINAKNCVGTVLSLNGHRKYFCMYHAKHPESGKGKSYKRMEKMAKQLARPQDPEAGAFIGFDDSDSEISQDESEPKVLYQENLLDGLPMWLDRLFEGSTQRYYINYWPDFTAK